MGLRVLKGLVELMETRYDCHLTVAHANTDIVCSFHLRDVNYLIVPTRVKWGLRA